MPILHECKDAVEPYVEKMSPSRTFVIRLTPFDKILASHPEVWGYATLQSSSENAEAFSAMLNGLYDICNPSIAKTFPRSSSAYLEELFDFVELADHAGASRIYVTISGDSARVSHSLRHE